MRYAAGVVATMLVLMAAAPAQAEGERWPPIPDAEEIIKNCEEVFNKDLDDSILASANRYESANLCLEKNIKENLEILLDDDALYRRQDSLDQRMNNIRNAISFFYNDIYNSNRACRVSCGTVWITASDQKVLDFYEDMLRTIIFLRKDRE